MGFNSGFKGLTFAHAHKPTTFHDFHRQYTRHYYKAEVVLRSDVINYPFS